MIKVADSDDQAFTKAEAKNISTITGGMRPERTFPIKFDEIEQVRMSFSCSSCSLEL